MTKRGEVRQYILDVLLKSDTDECILWPYSINKRHGYGRVAWEGLKYRTHWLICYLAHGAAPKGGMEVAHSCGTKACVNKRHLRWATPVENMADCRRHGTFVVGSKHCNTKLTECDVRNIRQQRAVGTERQSLMDFYDVSDTTIMNIEFWRSWKHVPRYRGPSATTLQRK